MIRFQSCKNTALMIFYTLKIIILQSLVALLIILVRYMKKNMSIVDQFLFALVSVTKNSNIELTLSLIVAWRHRLFFQNF